MSAWYAASSPNRHGVRYQWGTYARPPQAGFHLAEIMLTTGVHRPCCRDKAAAMADVGCINDVCDRCGQSVAVWPLSGGCYEPEVAEVWAD